MSSPYVFRSRSVRSIMFEVLLALVPGIVAYVWFFGGAVLVNLALASASALAAEAFMLKQRDYPIKPFVTDGSALLTAWLLALSVPPLAPWWLVVVGTVFAIVVAKHLYGGLGNNLFNPAMVGFAVLLISFPAIMTQWPAPLMLAKHPLSFGEQALYVLTGQLPPGVALDAINMATPLDTLKTQLKLDHTVPEALAGPVFGGAAGVGTSVVAFMYLLGGLYLLGRRIITWHIPVAFLAAIVVMSSFFYGIDADRYASPWFHLFGGATLLGAFFIATDMVTGATTPKGKLLFAGGIGVLVYVIRVFGGYPDGVAFAVLIMNAAVPLIDAYTQPPVFGHKGRTAKEAPK